MPMPFFKPLFSVFCLSLLALVLSPSLAQAGFKFIPASEEQMMPAEQKVFAPEPTQAQDFSIAAPSEPVVSEKLDHPPAMQAPVQMAPMAVVPQMAPKTAASTGLIIDPYPLGPHVATNHRGNVSGASVHKAMNEESGIAHPLQLGRNMSTMTKPVRVASTRQEMKQEPSPRTSLIPMPGGIVEPEMPKVKYMDAVGFGRDLPLALALSQVVPPNYAYSFAEDDSAGATVSWEGGKPWDQVLDDMLAPQGLRAIIEEDKKKVIISSAS